MSNKRLHTSNIRVHRVTYESHTSTYEQHTGNIRTHTDKRVKKESKNVRLRDTRHTRNRNANTKKGRINESTSVDSLRTITLRGWELFHQANLTAPSNNEYHFRKPISYYFLVMEKLEKIEITKN